MSLYELTTDILKLHDIFKKGFISAIIILFLNVRIILGAGIVYNPVVCPLSTTPDGLEVANCSRHEFNPRGPFYILNIASRLPASIQVIDLSPHGGGPSPIMFDREMFELYPQLQRIIIRNCVQFGPFVSELGPVDEKAVEKMVANLDLLQYLEISNCSLEDKRVVTLPRNLKTFIVNRNQYQHIDAHWSEVIEEINAEDNDLKNIPKLHFLNPPLHRLYLKRNPLDQMTVLDIAPLCELTLLEVEFPRNTYYTSGNGYCGCQMLKKWADEVEIKGLENIQCVPPRGGNTDCSESILAEARSLHKKCPLLKRGVLSSKLFSVIKYVFFATLLLLMLAVAILYVIRHFHLKEWYEHHRLLSLSHASSVKMEEAEEEPFRDRESSYEMPSEQSESSIEE